MGYSIKKEPIVSYFVHILPLTAPRSLPHFAPKDPIFRFPKTVKLSERGKNEIYGHPVGVPPARQFPSRWWEHTGGRFTYISPQANRPGGDRPTTCFHHPEHELSVSSSSLLASLPPSLHSLKDTPRWLERGSLCILQNKSSMRLGSIVASTERGMGVVRSRAGRRTAPYHCAWAQSSPCTGSALPPTRTREELLNELWRSGTEISRASLVLQHISNSYILMHTRKSTKPFG